LPGAGPAADVSPRATLGERIVYARDKLGMTIEDAADEIGVSQATWQQWENDTERPTLAEGRAMAGLLAVNIAWLCGDGPNQAYVECGARLRQERVKAGLSVAQLAGRLDVSQDEYASWETAAGWPDAVCLFWAARTLGVSEHWLLLGCERQALPELTA
jgi:transcriptional regulator with XRE-family HTH domain